MANTNGTLPAKSSSPLFLLGGHDLEMATIRQLLQQQGQAYKDAGLSWGAALSAYKNELDHPGPIYGIELTEDMEPPANYMAIDHHNQDHQKPSSLEQVASLLGKPLTREQQLIAANDKGYIPAMQALGATAKEIERVRRMDRRMQGATNHDEALGEQSIAENLQQQQGVTVVKALTPRFSTITDRLYGKAGRLIVYNNNKLVYYGPGIEQLAQTLSELIPEKAYYGGGDNGYFGIKDDVFSAEVLQQQWLPELLNLVAP